MKQKKIRSLGSISFDTKGNKLETLDNVTMPHSQYNKLYGLAMLAMVAIAAGSSLALTSCNSYNEPIEIPVVPQKTPKTADSTYVVPVVAVADTTASDALSGMFDCLGIPAVKTTGGLQQTGAIKEGTVILYNYHDDMNNSDYKLNINPELSTKDALVLEGTATSIKTGQVTYIRSTYTKTDGGFIDKKQATDDGKSPSASTVWMDGSVDRNILAVDGVKVYNIFEDGTESYGHKIVPKTETSVTEVAPSGGSSDITNIQVFKFHEVSTGLNDVHM